MAAGLAEHASGTKDPGPLDQPALDGVGDAGIQAAGITDGREAATQHGFEDELGFDRDPGRLSAHHGNEVQCGEGGMYVGIDQAGHHGPAFGVEDHDIGAGGKLAPVLGDFDDLVRFDPQRSSRPQFSSQGIQKLGVPDDEAWHGAAPEHNTGDPWRSVARMERSEIRGVPHSAALHAGYTLFLAGAVNWLR
jgi:hypothetical protein